jgi:hypothetical protein
MGTPPTSPCPANPIDLCTVDDVLGWLNAQSPPAATPPTDVCSIQAIITSWSSMFLWRTGRGPMDEEMPTESPFNSIVNYVEAYDGNGHSKLYLRNYPIQSVNSLQIGNNTIVLSPGYGQAGYSVSVSKKYLHLRPGGGTFFGSLYGSWYGSVFWKGIQNVFVDYMAGYDPEPADIMMACIKSVALEYRRRSYIGVSSKSMAQGAGTISYLSPAGAGGDKGASGGFEYDPDVERLILNYTRPWLTI